MTNYKSIYQYDILGNTFESLGYNSNVAWFANQFTANSDNPLTAFGLYTFGSSEYLVNITVNGISKYVSEGSIKGAGYHTIKLDEYVNLNLGDVFRIIVRLTTPDSKFPIAIESQRSGYSSKSTASLSQSFVSSDGVNWQDIAKNTELVKFYEAMDGDHLLNKTNVCLKAYTAFAGNLVLNTTSNTSLFLNGDVIEVEYNLSNMGDFMSDINLSLALSDSVKVYSVDSLTKGYFDLSSNTWAIDSLNSRESAVLRIKIVINGNEETVDNYAIVSTSTYNAGHSGYLYDLNEDELIREENVFRLFYSGFSRFLDIGNISTFAKSGEKLNITLVDILDRPLANKTVHIIFANDDAIDLTEDGAGELIDLTAGGAGELIDLTAGGAGELIDLTTDENGVAEFSLDFLEGNYSFEISFDGDSEFEASNITFNLTVIRMKTSFKEDNLNSLSILSLSNEKIEFALLDQFSNPVADKTIYLVDLDSDSSDEDSFDLITDEEGNASFSFNLTEGNHHFIILFGGDERYLSSSLEFEIDVIKRDAPFILMGNGLIGSGEKFTVCLIDNQFNVLHDKLISLEFIGSKNMTFTYDLFTDENGVAAVSNLTYGNYTVNVLFEDDCEYEDSFYNDFNLIVLGKEVFIETSDFEKYYGDDSPYEIRLTEDETVTFEINNINHTAVSDANDTARADIDLPVGTYNITSYYNNTKYVNVLTVKSTVIASDVNLSYKEDCNYSIQLLDSSGNPLINSSVDIIVNGEASQYVSDENGTVIISFENLKASQIINVTNPKTNETKTNEILVAEKINRTKTKIIFEDMVTFSVSQIDGRIGDYFIVSLRDENGNNLVQKDIKIGFNGKIYNRTTDENGSARLQINLPAQGVYTFAIAFLGDDDYEGSFEVAKIKVNPQSPVLTASNKIYKSSAKTKTLSVSFKTSKSNAVSGKTVSFTVNGKVYTAKTNSKGIATVNVSLNKKGTYSFTYKFAGDDTFKSVTKKAKLVIK